MNINFQKANPKEDIVRRISNLLGDYHETTLLREKLQNSDDAGATLVKVHFDKCRYSSTGTLFKGDTASILQEEAVMFFNNAVFKEKDWTGLMNLGSGSKSEDIKSVGKFGLGFNSIYHITDYPMILSGDQFAVHDILGNIIPDGLQTNFLKERLSSFYPNQMEPFKKFGCNFKEFFNGTIFRLPFRKNSSRIKEEPMSMGTFDLILDEFIEQSQHLLLFMRNVSTIEISNSNGLLFRVSINNPEKIKEARQLVYNSICKISDKMGEYNMKKFKELVLAYKDELLMKSFMMDLEITDNRNGEMKITNNKYVMTNGFVVDGFKNIEVHNKAKFIPCGGIATPLGLSVDELVTFKSIPFSFLPIGDIRYSLPFHFNGSFILSNARTDIHFSNPTNELTTSDIKNSKWNEHILSTIIPTLYLNNLEYIISNNLLSNELLYYYYPHYCNNGRDQAVQDKVIQKILEKKFFKNLFTLEFHLLKDCYALLNSLDEDIIQVLKKRNVVVIQLPERLYSLLKEIENIKIIDQSSICSFLKPMQLEIFNYPLLSYLLSDLSVDISNIKLFPSTYGDLKSISNNDSDTPIYISDQNAYDILKTKESDLLDIDLFTEEEYNSIKSNFKGLKNKYCSLKELTSDQFIDRLVISFPSFVKPQSITDSIPFDLEKFWNFIQKSFFENGGKYLSLNCIPVELSNGTIGYTSLNYKRLLHPFKLMYGYENISMIKDLLNKLDFVFAIDELLPYRNNCEQILSSLQPSDILKLNNEEIDLLRKYFPNSKYFELSNLKSANNDNFINILNLPIFNIAGTSQYSSVHDNSICISDSLVNIISYSKYIPQQIILLEEEYLNLKYLSKCKKTEFQIYEQFIIPEMSKFPQNFIDEIVQFIIVNYSNFISPQLKTHRWVPTRTGDLNYITSIILQKDEKFNQLIEYLPNGGSHLIDKKFEEYSPQLKVLGAVESLPENFLVLLAQGMKSVENSDDCLDLLFYFISKNKVDVSTIKDIEFLPTLEEKFGSFKSHFDSNRTISFISPSNCFSNEVKNLCFTNSFISKFSSLPPNLNQYLKKISISDVISHFKTLVDQFNQIKFNLETDFPILQEIYKYLNFNWNEDSLVLEFKQFKSIWTGSKYGFQNFEQVILDQEQKLMPFFYPVDPAIIIDVSNFNLKIKVGKVDCLMMLEDISKMHFPDFNLIYLTIQELYNNMYELTPEERNNLCLPCRGNILAKYEKIIFSPFEEEFTEFSILDQKYSLEIAKYLKIPNITEKRIRGTLFGENFGQNENLYSRINGIIENYQSETFLKEIVQNSLDAGADTVYLMLDRRNYLDQIYQSEMEYYGKNFKQYLSPSLVYGNNSTMSEEDIENIQNLGDSSKKFDSSVVGQYGIGFNSVYNFTDVPSIIARQCLYIFDPLKTHFSTEEKPGRKYSFSERNHLKNPFLPINYPYFGLNLDDFFSQTLFRLPLRNSPSKISKQIWDTCKINQIFNKFKEIAKDCLLFNPSMKKIIFFEWKSTENVPIQVFKVESSSSLEDNLIIHKSMANNCNLDVIYKLDIKEAEFTNTERISEWKVGVRIGSNNHEILEMTKLGSKKYPCGGVAICYSGRIKGHPFCFFPLPKPTNLPVHIHGSFDLISSRQALVSSIDTFSDPTFDFNEHDCNSEHFRSHWNLLLQREMIAPMYAKVLKQMTSKFKEKEIDIFYELFPTSNSWKYIVKFFYQEAQALEIYAKLTKEQTLYQKSSDLIVWSGIENNIISKLDFQPDIFKILLTDGFNIIYIPQHVTDNLKDLNKLNTLNHKTISNFYRISYLGNKYQTYSIFDPPKKSLGQVENILKLLKYLNNHETDYEGLPLLLLQDEETIMVFSKKGGSLLYFSADYIQLYPIHKSYAHKEISKKCLEYNVKNPSYPDFFINHLYVYIIRNFTNLNDDLKKIYHSLFSNLGKFDEPQRKKLKNFDLIPYQLNDQLNFSTFKPIHYFYHPKFQCLNTLLNIIPEFFNPLMHSLSELGLKYTLSVNDFINICGSISQSWKLNPQISLIDYGRFLMYYLKNEFCQNDQSNIIFRISHLCIVPCKKIRDDYIGSAPFTELSTINQTANSSSTNLLFTTHLLRECDDWVKDTHSPSLYFKNLKNILENVQSWPQPYDFLIEIITQHFEILNEYNVSSISSLNLPISQNELTTINDLYIIIPYQVLSPYFKTIPEFYTKYYHILKKIGCKEINYLEIHKKLKSFLNQKVQDIDLIRTICKRFDREKNYFNRCEEIGFDQNKIFRSSNILYYIDNPKMVEKINIKDHLFEAHRKNVIKIQPLSKYIRECINLEKTTIIQNNIPKLEKILENEFIQSKLQTVDSKTLLSMSFKLCNLSIRYFLISNDQDITLKDKGSKYFYDKAQNILYIDNVQQENILKILKKLIPEEVVKILKLKIVYKTNKNPLQTYKIGEEAFYKTEKGKTKCIIVGECDLDFSELKLYHIMINDNETISSVPSTILYKPSGQGNMKEPYAESLVILFREISNSKDGIEKEMSIKRLESFVISSKTIRRKLLSGIPPNIKKESTDQ